MQEAIASSLLTIERELPKSPHNSLIILAVSGGEDSVVLLDACLALGAPGVEFTIAHINHGLREASEQEDEFVRNLGVMYGIHCHVHRAPPRPPEQNLEAWARRIRYAYFEQLRSALGARAIYTAHHQDDVAETKLLRVFSGREKTDSRGIAPFSRDSGILRPFFKVPKAAITAYRQAHNLSFVEDESNSDLRRSRNVIRHRVLPLLLEEGYPNLKVSLAEQTLRDAADEAFLNATAQQHAEAMRAAPLVSTLRALPPALCWRVLRELAVFSFGEEARKLGFRALSRAQEFVEVTNRQNQVLELGFGFNLHFEREGGELCVRFRMRPEEPPGTIPEILATELSIPGMLQFGAEWSLEACIRGAEVDSRNYNLMPEARCFEAVFNLEAFSGNTLQVRARLPGDEVKVEGRGRRKLKKLIQEHGLPAAARNRLPIVLYKDEIIWVPGLCVGALGRERGRPGNSTLLLRAICKPGNP